LWTLILVLNLKILMKRCAGARIQQDPEKMTKLLDEAIEKVRELPDAVQDDAAQMLFSLAAKQRGLVELDEETLAAVLEGRAQARRGEFVSDEKMQAFFERHGVKP
jgi:predicted transcriptional regulator